MNKLIFRIFVSTLLIALPTYGLCANELSVDGILKDKNSSPIILFKIRNISQKEIVLDNSEIPNGGTNHLIIDAVTKNGRKQLERLPIGIDSAGITIVRSGESIESELSLNDCIKGLADALHKDDVVIFWLYQPEDKHLKELGSFSGWILVPRMSLKTENKKVTTP
jgi:hypothetical protein